MKDIERPEKVKPAAAKVHAEKTKEKKQKPKK
jgi:hypothetical protein